MGACTSHRKKPQQNYKDSILSNKQLIEDKQEKTSQQQQQEQECSNSRSNQGQLLQNQDCELQEEPQPQSIRNKQVFFRKQTTIMQSNQRTSLLVSKFSFDQTELQDVQRLENIMTQKEANSQKQIQLDKKKKKKKKTANTARLRPSLFVSKMFESDFKDHYKIQKMIGKGGYGQVYLAEHKQTKILRAVKVIKKQDISYKYAQNQLLYSEIDNLKSIDHPNIIKINQIFEDETCISIVTEYCEGGDLFSKVVNDQFYTESEIKRIIKSILSALIYCHKRKIVHRDIKPENIMFSSVDGQLKVIDFGASRKILHDEQLTRKIGSLIYIAPEIICQPHYDEKCDIWSTGVLLYMMLVGHPPFYNSNEKKQLKLILHADVPYDPDMWDSVSPLAKDLVHNMLQKNPKKRITAVDAFNHPWFKNDDSQEKNLLSLNVIQRLGAYSNQNLLCTAIQWFVFVQTVEKEEQDKLIQLFTQMDTNGDGSLSKEELINGLEGYGADHFKTLTFIDKIFSEIDTNKSGEIDFIEFSTAAINARRVFQEENLKKAFQIFDIDNNGYITLDELQQVFKGMQIEEEQWQEILEKCDANKDGKLALEEFMVLLTSFQHLIPIDEE